MMVKNQIYLLHKGQNLINLLYANTITCIASAPIHLYAKSLTSFMRQQKMITE